MLDERQPSVLLREADIFGFHEQHKVPGRVAGDGEASEDADNEAAAGLDGEEDRAGGAVAEAAEERVAIGGDEEDHRREQDDEGDAATPVQELLEESARDKERRPIEHRQSHKSDRQKPKGAEALLRKQRAIPEADPRANQRAQRRGRLRSENAADTRKRTLQPAREKEYPCVTSGHPHSTSAFFFVGIAPQNLSEPAKALYSPDPHQDPVDRLPFCQALLQAAPGL